MIDTRRMGPVDQARHARRRNAPHPDFIAKLDQQWQEHVLRMREYDRLGFRGDPERYGWVDVTDQSDSARGLDGQLVTVSVMGCPNPSVVARAIAGRFANRLGHIIGQSMISTDPMLTVLAFHAVGPWDKRWWEVAP